VGKNRRKFGDRFEEGVGIQGADALGSGKRTEHTDGANSGASSHLNVFRRVSHVDGIPRPSAHLLKSNFEGRGVGFAPRRVFGAHARGKDGSELEFLELPVDAVAAAAGDDAELEFGTETFDDAAGAGKKFGMFAVVGLMPEAVGLIPFFARELRGFVDAEPVGRIVTLEIVERPGNLKGVEHGQVSASVGIVGVEEGAVPIEKDSASLENGPHQQKRIVPEFGDLAGVITRWKLVVAVQRDIVEAGGVASPAGDVDFFGADDMRGGEQLDATHAERAVDEGDFELDGGPRFDFTRGEKIYAA